MEKANRRLAIVLPIHTRAKKEKISDDVRNCTTFLYGDEAKCKVSKAAVGVGVMVL